MATRLATPAQPYTVYSVHPGVDHVMKAMAGLKEKTGFSLDEWLAIIDRDGPAGESARAEWLKQAHGLGTNYARWLAGCSVGRNDELSDPEAYLQMAVLYVDQQYDGAKSGLRPIYNALLAAGFALAHDVRACPCKTMVPLYRNHVFAEIKPSTRTRVDLGLALRDTAVPKRLIDTGGFKKKDRITHRIAISSVEAIDDEVRKWMRKAYEMDA